jgi:RNA polymerase-binding transcription factor DksA
MKRVHGNPGEGMVGLSSDELRSLRKLLLARKAELLDSYSSLEGEACRKGNEAGELAAVRHHPADLGSDAFEQTLSLALLANESSALREIDLALGRMDEGTYGACQECGDSIGKSRLRALPQATLCRSCKSLEESCRA